MLRTLDVSHLSKTATYQGEGGAVDLDEVVNKRTMPTIKVWTEHGLVRPNTSFGYAVARPNVDPGLWDTPEAFVLFVGGFGDNWEQYVKNALRKLRAAIRTQRDTYDLRLNSPDLFIDQVEKQEADGSALWGDFPHGGAALVPVGGLVIPVGTSALEQDEDDMAAKTIGSWVGNAIHRIDRPELFTPRT